jgi:hypothetical protein
MGFYETLNSSRNEEKGQIFQHENYEPHKKNGKV